MIIEVPTRPFFALPLSVTRGRAPTIRQALIVGRIVETYLPSVENALGFATSGTCNGGVVILGWCTRREGTPSLFELLRNA